MSFIFNDTATTEIYTLSLHDALPMSASGRLVVQSTPSAANVTIDGRWRGRTPLTLGTLPFGTHNVRVVRQGYEVFSEDRSEEHTSELQSRQYLVCRLLLEKKGSQSSG